MRKMTQAEMTQLIHESKWATICATGLDGSPYAIEATPFFMDEDICFMINPRGGVYRCMARGDMVLVKFTDASPDLRLWGGVSCRGRGTFVRDANVRKEGWRLLGLVMGQDYSKASEVLDKEDRSPLFRIRVETMTGRCSGAWGRGRTFPEAVKALPRMGETG
ncbi:MAG: hypothetical protein V3573_13025 [Desulfovibrionaceae bacterium]